MYSYNMIQWLFIFYFYCFFGWCFESAYVSLKEKKPVNRGFMRGPFLPLYGSGAVMMLIVSAPFQGNVFFTYLAGCVGATILEYVTGVVMEALFKVRYWDYSKQRFQFQGHICLKSTLAWGLLTIFMTQWLHEQIESIIFKIPFQWQELIVFLVTIVLVVDFTLSFKAAMDLRDILIKMEQAKEEIYRIQKRLDVMIAVVDEDLNQRTEIIRKNMDELRDDMEDKLEELKDRLTLSPMEHVKEIQEELAELKYKYRAKLEQREYLGKLRGFYQRGLMKAHPSMTSVKFKEALEEVKEYLKEKVEK